MTRARFIVSSLAALALAPTLSAARPPERAMGPRGSQLVIHVDDEAGDDANPGTEAAPVATLARAAEIARLRTDGEVSPDSRPSLKAWPNPARRSVTVAGADGPVSVYDALGRRVYRSRVVGGSARLDLSALAPGRYTIRDTSGCSAPITVTR